MKIKRLIAIISMIEIGIAIRMNADAFCGDKCDEK